MKKHSLAIMALALLSPITALAGNYSGLKTLRAVEVSDAWFTVHFADGNPVHPGCQQADKVVYWRSDFPNGYNTLLSTALAAYASGNKVSMWFGGCKAGPWGPTLPKAETLVIGTM